MDGLIERYAYDAFVAQEINANLTPSEDELMAFYEANKAEKYMDKKKVGVREIFIKDSLFAVSIKKRLDAGEAFEKLAARYTDRKRHVWTPVTQWSRMPSSAWKKKKKHKQQIPLH